MNLLVLGITSNDLHSRWFFLYTWNNALKKQSTIGWSCLSIFLLILKLNLKQIWRGALWIAFTTSTMSLLPSLHHRSFHHSFLPGGNWYTQLGARLTQNSNWMVVVQMEKSTLEARIWNSSKDRLKRLMRISGRWILEFIKKLAMHPKSTTYLKKKSNSIHRENWKYPSKGCRKILTPNLWGKYWPSGSYDRV